MRRVERRDRRAAELPLGGTAVGTGINTHPEFARAGRSRRSRRRPASTFVEAAEPLRGDGRSATPLVEASGALKTSPVSLSKIANDIRWLASGPRCGIGEISIPDLQPGSSIMPGKVNPVIPERLLMVAAQVVGNDATIAWAAAGLGRTSSST